MRIYRTVLLGIFFYTLFFTSSTYAAEYYLSPNGNDSNVGNSTFVPWKTFVKAWTILQPDDTLFLMDGTYFQTLNPNISGTETQPITIKAINDGKVTIDGENQRDPVLINTDWLIIEGIVARNGNRVRGTNVITLNSNAEYNILRRVSAYDSWTDDNTFVISVSGKYNLIEDCIASGTGRKMILLYGAGSQYNTIRRCFAAWQRWDGRVGVQTWPWGEQMEFYNSSNNTFENNIAYGKNSNAAYSFLSQGGGDGISGNKLLGSMAINTGRNYDNTLMFWGPDPNSPDCCTQVQPLIRPLDPNGLTVNPNHIADLYNTYMRSGVGFYPGALIENMLIKDTVIWGSAGVGLAVNISAGVTSPNFDPANITVENTTITNNGLDPDHALYTQEVRGGELPTFINSYVEDDPNNIGPGARLECRYENGVLQDCASDPSKKLWPWPMDSRVQAELGINVTNTMIPILDQAGVPHGYNQSISPTATPIPGDINNDGIVDMIDFRTTLFNYSKTNQQRINGDLNSDGKVNMPDIIEVFANVLF